jgi:hypothetical protein
MTDRARCASQQAQHNKPARYLMAPTDLLRSENLWKILSVR